MGAWIRVCAGTSWLLHPPSNKCAQAACPYQANLSQSFSSLQFPSP